MVKLLTIGDQDAVVRVRKISLVLTCRLVHGISETSGIIVENFVFIVFMSVETSGCPLWGRDGSGEEGGTRAVAGLSRGCSKYSTLH
jgi:hypothetical protein